MPEVDQISNQTKTLFKAFGFEDSNNDGRISQNEPGYQKKFDPDGNGITPQEAWNEYCNHVDEYPHVKIENFKNPFETDQDLIDFTHEVIEGADSDFEIAQQLFFSITPVEKTKDDPGFENYDGKKKNIPYDNDPKKRIPGGYANASEVFDNGYALCLEYSFLYVAMAREAGLSAQVCYVTIDQEGRPICHACALVTLKDGRTFQVDPTFGIFQEIEAPEDSTLTPLTDSEALALYYFNTASLCRLKGDINAAKSCYETAIDIYPGLEMAHYEMAIIYRREGNIDMTIHHLLTAVTANPKMPAAHHLLTDICCEENEYFDPVLEHYKMLIQSDPDNEIYHKRLIRNSGEYDNYASAAEFYEQLLRENPDNPTVIKYAERARRLAETHNKS